jgi:hypothetical protein
MISITPTRASPPARRATPAGNHSRGRKVSRSRAVGTTATASSAATPSVVPTDKMSSAVSGSRDNGRSLSAGAKARYAEMTTRLEMAGPRAGPAKRRYACSSP